MSSPLFRAETSPLPDDQARPTKRQRFFNSSSSPVPPPIPSTSTHEKQVEMMELEDTPQPTSSSSSWECKYFGDVIVKGFALASSSTFVKLSPGDPVTLVRVKPSPVDILGGKKSTSALKKLENDVVRYKNEKGIDVGRVGKSDGIWLARLMDHEMLKVKGFAAEVPLNFRSGKSLLLLLPFSLSLSLFLCED